MATKKEEKPKELTNEEKIKEIYRINDELQVLLEVESNLYKKAMDNKDRKVNIVDKKTRGIRTATEGEMWEEVRVVGLNGEAGKRMEKEYPRLIKTAKMREVKNNELRDFIKIHFQFDFSRMGIADYMKITEAMIDYKMGKKK